jgi:CBS domain-containing membrane protein
VKVAELMVREVVTLGANHHLEKAREEMEANGIRHLPIVDGDNRLVGLITERDLLQLREGANPRIGDVMHVELETASLETAAHEAAYLMLRYAIGCVPITADDGTLLGLVTDTDFVRVAYIKLGGRVSLDEIEEEEHGADNV